MVGVSEETGSLLLLGRSISLIYVYTFLIPIIVWYCYSSLKWQRFGRYKGLPELPKSFLWGHLETMGLEMEKNKVKQALYSHPDYAIHRLYQSMPEQKGAMALNLWPAENNMLYIASHKIAEQLSKSSKDFPYSVWKSPTMHSFDALVGKDSILMANGEVWKGYRKLFNPGFAPNHLITLLPQILSKTKIFLARLDALAKSGAEFEGEVLFTTLTFDIIGAVTLGIDLNAQQDDVSKQHPVVRDFVACLKYFDDFFAIKFKPLWPIKRWLAGRKLQKTVEAIIWQKWDEMKKERQGSDGATGKSKDKSVLGLALKDLQHMDSSIVRITASQLQSFLFAGHDTTSSLLQWAMYKLSVDEAARNALDTELDNVFGKGDIFEELSKPDGGSLISQLPYTSAIIKETLRLYPPASSARRTPRGTGLKLRLDDDSEILADDIVLYVSHFGIHRDPNAYGADAEIWKPERWVGNADTSANTTDDPVGDQKKPEEIPASAWRAFERGNRNCIGQELANLEARIILACMARKYIFTKVGYGSKEGEEPLNKWQITSKPLDGMRMSVKFASNSS